MKRFSSTALLSASRSALIMPKPVDRSRLLFKKIRYRKEAIENLSCRTFSSSTNHGDEEPTEILKLRTEVALDGGKVASRTHIKPLKEDFPVDSSYYRGPALAEGPLDESFPKVMMEYFKKTHIDSSLPPLPPKYVFQLLLASIEQHRQMSSLLRIPLRREGQSMTVFGDTHGQFYDFCNILTDNVAGYPSRDNMLLFNGDFVDRGQYGLEIMLSLLAMRLANPEALYLTRGNHETEEMNSDYNFYTDIDKMYHKAGFSKNTIDDIIMLFQRTFDTLPVAAVLNEKVFVVHGGIGIQTSKMSLDEINSIWRFQDPDYVQDMKGRYWPDPLNELLWSDPGPQLVGFKRSPRGGISFGRNITEKFLRNNNLELLVRSHEVVMSGVGFKHGEKCVTVFSAPNYCGVLKNKGGALRFKCGQPMNKPEIIRFRAVHAPMEQIVDWL